jgi:hypothetical protein
MKLPLPLLLLLLWVHPDRLPAATEASHTSRITQLLLHAVPSFDIAADPTTGALHCLYLDQDARLCHASSTNEGLSWTTPQPVAPGTSFYQPVAAIDSRHTLHVLFRDRSHSSETWYARRSRDIWQSPRLLYRKPKFTPEALRIAVDGRDNIHALLWAWPDNFKDIDWQKITRCIYLHVPADQASFDPPIEWANHDNTSGAGHGDIAIDPIGNAHIIYNSYHPSRAGTPESIEHRIRSASGQWTAHRVYTNISGDGPMEVGDAAIAAAVDARLSLHLALHANFGQWSYRIFECPPGSSTLVQRMATNEMYDVYSCLLPAPDGSAWLATLNCDAWWGNDPHTANRASFFQFNPATRSWGPRRFLSPARDFRNTNDRFGQQPRIVRTRNHISIFFLEKPPGAGSFTLCQRLFPSNP